MSQEESLQMANKELEKVGQALSDTRRKYRRYGPYVPDVAERINLLTNQRRRLQRRIKKIKTILSTDKTTPQPKIEQQVLFSLEPTTAESPNQKFRRQSSTEPSRMCPHCFARNYGKHKGDTCDNCQETI